MVLEPSFKEKESLAKQREMWKVLGSQCNHIVSREDLVVLLTQELVAYQSLESAAEEVEADEWWGLVAEVKLGGEEQFPIMSFLALGCCTISPSSSEAERDFSAMSDIFANPKSNATEQELLDAKMVVKSSMKQEQETCARCVASIEERNKKLSKGETVPKRFQISHCHCSLVRIDDDLLADIRSCEPFKKEKKEQEERAKENKAKEKEQVERKAKDDAEEENDLKKEITDMKRKFQDARVRALKNKEDMTEVKVPKKRIAIEKLDETERKKKKLQFVFPKMDGNDNIIRNSEVDDKIPKKGKLVVRKDKKESSIERMLRKKKEQEKEENAAEQMKKKKVSKASDKSKIKMYQKSSS